MQLTTWQFKDKYLLKRVDRFDEPEYVNLVHEVLGATPPLEGLLPSHELQRHKELQSRCKSPFTIRIGAYEGNRLVASTYGWQSEDSTFYMGISLVHPDHRRQGIYSELLKAVISTTREEGFQLIQSHHRATNNPVIIAKLSAGFAISGLDLSDTMGALVRLTYFHNPERRKLLDSRVGLVRPEGRLRDLFF